jgi:hypothetical protein
VILTPALAIVADQTSQEFTLDSSEEIAGE